MIICYVLCSLLCQYQRAHTLPSLILLTIISSSSRVSSCAHTHHTPHTIIHHTMVESEQALGVGDTAGRHRQAERAGRDLRQRSYDRTRRVQRAIPGHRLLQGHVRPRQLRLRQAVQLGHAHHVQGKTHNHTRTQFVNHNTNYAYNQLACGTN